MVALVVALGIALLIVVTGGFVLLARRLPAGDRASSREAPGGTRGAAGPAQGARSAAELDQLRAAAEADAAQTRRLAEEEAARTRERAASDADLARARLEADLADARSRVSAVTERERHLSAHEERLEEERARTEERARRLAAEEGQLAERRAVLERLESERLAMLERVAGLTAEQARAELVEAIEAQAKREAALRVRDIEAEARQTAEERAREIVTLAIQRVASDQTAESVVTVLHLPAEEMKGRIIGREGRNIRSFEAVTGVNVIIDDTPEAVLLSCFDPVRREVGRLTLEKLVADGRIHPHRIEETYERSKAEVDALCRRAGEQAVLDVGVGDMHPELIDLLGRLKYRTSYGQNVLAHLVEAAHLSGVMAAELRLPPVLVKRGTLLHDLGKALTHEVEGSHALIGADLARRYGEHEDVVHAIEAHHDEVEPRTIGAVLTQAADAVSGGRPGARRESLEAHVRRLERMEEIARARPGVDKVFCMQAGREVRVMVIPEQVDDIGAAVLAREVAKQITDELTFPGQIRVTVIRETRASEIAR